MRATLLFILPLLSGAVEPRASRLDNGLRVVVARDAGWPRVCVELWYQVGTADDDPGRPGVCDMARSLLARRGALRDAGHGGPALQRLPMRRTERP